MMDEKAIGDGAAARTSHSDEDTTVGAMHNGDSEKAQHQQQREHSDMDNEKGRQVSVYDGPIDPEVERRLLRKLDTYLTPLVGFLFLLSFLDRSNIGNAKIAGMQTDLKLSSDDYEWLLTIFYIAYIIFQWLGFMWRVTKPHYWGFFITCAWGIVSTCQAATFNWSGMMALRFLLGAAEAGFGPSIPFLLSFFYKRREIGLRCGIFLSAAPLASTFAGALAYGITSGHSKLANWRLLFLVEGIPSILCSFLAFYLLPDSPAQARYLTAEEAEVARRRARAQHGAAGEKSKTGVNFGDIGRTFMDPKSWFTPLMYFSLNVSYSSLPVFLPTILAEMGFSNVNAQGLSAPPYFVAFGVTILTTWFADKTGQRGFMIASLAAIGGVGYIMLATCKSVGARYAGVYLAAIGVFPAIGNILPWVVNNQGSDSGRGAGIVLLNLIGQCGPLLGTRIYPAEDKPYYVKGQSISAAFLFFTVFLALGLRTTLAWQNKKLDEKYGPVEVETEEEGSENFGKNFRYVL